jgi:ethanolaminephosphotransferase
MGAASPSCAAVAGWTVAAVLLQVVGLSLFLYGFFPVKPTLPGFRCAPLASAQLRFL